MTTGEAPEIHRPRIGRYRPASNKAECENQPSRLSSDLHRHTIVCTHLHTQKESREEGGRKKKRERKREGKRVISSMSGLRSSVTFNCSLSVFASYLNDHHLSILTQLSILNTAIKKE